MKVRIALTILLGLVSISLFACTCLGNSTSFSIPDYDAADLIVELKAGEVTHDDTAYQSQLLNWEKEVVDARAMKQPSPLRPERTGKVSVKVTRVYKGEVESGEIVLAGSYNGASCGWLPTPGEYYLLYLSKGEEEDGLIVYPVNQCMRILHFQFGDFNSERRILRDLASVKDGKLLANQEEYSARIGSTYSAFKGEFKDGKRVGEWVIYRPYRYWQDSVNYDLPILSLIYDNGNLIQFKFLIDEPKRQELRAELRSWYYWFSRMK